MKVCKKCKSRRIKTRSNVSYCKSFSTPIECKDCGCTEFIDPDQKWARRR